MNQVFGLWTLVFGFCFSLFGPICRMANTKTKIKVQSPKTVLLQMYLLANFVFQILKAFDCSMFDLVQLLGLGFFNLLREPNALDQVESEDADDDNHQQR